MLTKGQVKDFAGARRSLGEEKDRRSSGGAAYMQLFNGGRLRGNINGKEWN